MSLERYDLIRLVASLLLAEHKESVLGPNLDGGQDNRENYYACRCINKAEAAVDAMQKAYDHFDQIRGMKRT